MYVCTCCTHAKGLYWSWNHQCTPCTYYVRTYVRIPEWYELIVYSFCPWLAVQCILRHCWYMGTSVPLIQVLILCVCTSRELLCKLILCVWVCAVMYTCTYVCAHICMYVCTCAHSIVTSSNFAQSITLATQRTPVLLVLCVQPRCVEEGIRYGHPD